MGFSNQIKIRKEEFTCLGECNGDTPSVAVADGICVAPTSKKSDHIHEFKPHEESIDDSKQSTSFKDRTFLIKKAERLILRQFVLEEITINDFLQLESFTSGNGLLIRTIQGVQIDVASGMGLLQECFWALRGPQSLPWDPKNGHKLLIGKKHTIVD